MAPWFTDSERRELATPVIKRLIRAIKDGRREDALCLCDLLRDERIILHDFYADACVALYTWIGRNLGEEQLHDMFTHIFEQSARRQLYDIFAMKIPPGVEAMLLCRSGWVAHSCSGAGEHGGSFRLIEDKEKLTFVMDPCGSGGRLWRKGRYEPPVDLDMTSQPYPWTYSREGFPYYCVHCAFLNELLPYQHLGFITWPVDPPEHAMDNCKWHIYKDKEAIPERYYERFGLRKQPVSSKRAGRVPWFTKQWRTENARYTHERIREKLEQGHDKAASRICRKMGGEFFFLHSLYVNMLVATLDFVARQAGQEGLGNALSFAFEKVLNQPGQAIPLTDGLSRQDTLKFIIHNYFLADTCGGGGIPKSKFRIVEGEDDVKIILNPCGSGGKLIRHATHETIGRAKETRERIENNLIKLVLMIPDSLMKLALRLPVARPFTEFLQSILFDYITETRKPEGMGVVHEAQAWTGNRKDLPIYCSFCTAFLHQSGCDWLEVTPPTSRRQACVWRAKK